MKQNSPLPLCSEGKGFALYSGETSEKDYLAHYGFTIPMKNKLDIIADCRLQIASLQEIERIIDFTWEVFSDLLAEGHLLNIAVAPDLITLQPADPVVVRKWLEYACSLTFTRTRSASALYNWETEFHGVRLLILANEGHDLTGTLITD